MFVAVYLSGGGLLKSPRPKQPLHDLPRTSSSKLHLCLKSLKLFLDYILTLPPTALNSFTSVDWVKYILAVILTIRISFDIPECPDWDANWARLQLRFDKFLDQICQTCTDLTPSSKKTDVLSATRIIMAIVKEKYDRRMIFVGNPEQPLSSTIQGCPILDASFEQYFPLWDDTFGTTKSMPSKSSGGRPVFHDLWATMTMGWSNTEDSEAK